MKKLHSLTMVCSLAFALMPFGTNRCQESGGPKAAIDLVRDLIHSRENVSYVISTSSFDQPIVPQILDDDKVRYFLEFNRLELKEKEFPLSTADKLNGAEQRHEFLFVADAIRLCRLPTTTSTPAWSQWIDANKPIIRVLVERQNGKNLVRPFVMTPLGWADIPLVSKSSLKEAGQQQEALVRLLSVKTAWKGTYREAGTKHDITVKISAINPRNAAIHGTVEFLNPKAVMTFIGSIEDDTLVLSHMEVPESDKHQLLADQYWKLKLSKTGFIGHTNNRYSEIELAQARFDPVPEAQPSPQNILADKRVLNVAPGSPDRKAVCDALRAHLASKYTTKKLPRPVVFQLHAIRIQGDHGYTESTPLFEDDSQAVPDYLPDIDYTHCLQRQNGHWRVIVDLSGSDVPSQADLKSLKQGFPSDFPMSLLSQSWQKLLD